MKKVLLKDATRDQMWRFAKINLQLANLQPNIGDDKLRERIKSCTGEDEIYTHESEKEEIGKAVRNPVDLRTARKSNVKLDPLRFAYRDPRFLIQIVPEKGKGGKAPVPVSVNGTCMLLPRGEQIEVPARYFFALSCAVQTLIEDAIDEKTKVFERTETDVQTYQYTILRQPTADEIDAWQEDMENFEKEANLTRRRNTAARKRELEAAA